MTAGGIGGTGPCAVCGLCRSDIADFLLTNGGVLAIIPGLVVNLGTGCKSALTGGVNGLDLEKREVALFLAPFLSDLTESGVATWVE